MACTLCRILPIIPLTIFHLGIFLGYSLLQVLQYALDATFQIKNYFHAKQEIKSKTKKVQGYFEGREERVDLTEFRRINVQEALTKIRHDIVVIQRTIKLISDKVNLDEPCH